MGEPSASYATRVITVSRPCVRCACRVFTHPAGFKVFETETQSQFLQDCISDQIGRSRKKITVQKKLAGFNLSRRAIDTCRFACGNRRPRNRASCDGVITKDGYRITALGVSHMHVSRGIRQSFLTLLTVLFATAAFAQATSTPAKPAGLRTSPGPGQAADSGQAGGTIRTARRPAGQGRGVGADSPGARRQDARHGEGHAQRFRHGSRVR